MQKMSAIWTYTKILPKRAKCVKCAENHMTADCTKQDKAQPRCVNYNEAHLLTIVANETTKNENMKKHQNNPLKDIHLNHVHSLLDK